MTEIQMLLTVSEFDDYVTRGYYSQWFRDNVEKYGRELTDVKSDIIRHYRLSQIPLLENCEINQKDHSTVIVSEELLKHIQSFLYEFINRVMVGNHGVYIETNELPYEARFVKKHKQYDEYRTHVKWYKQTDTVNYADYKVGKNYVLFTDVLT